MHRPHPLRQTTGGLAACASSCGRHLHEIAAQVAQREPTLRHKFAELRIAINQTNRWKNIEEVLVTDFFGELQNKAQQLRQH
jgi:hypothetical protein